MDVFLWKSIRVNKIIENNISITIIEIVSLFKMKLFIEYKSPKVEIIGNPFWKIFRKYSLTFKAVILKLKYIQNGNIIKWETMGLKIAPWILK